MSAPSKSNLKKSGVTTEHKEDRQVTFAVPTAPARRGPHQSQPLKVQQNASRSRQPTVQTQPNPIDQRSQKETPGPGTPTLSKGTLERKRPVQAAPSEKTIPPRDVQNMINNEKQFVAAKKGKGHVDNVLYVTVKESEQELLETCSLCTRVKCECQNLEEETRETLQDTADTMLYLSEVKSDLEELEHRLSELEVTGICQAPPRRLTLFEQLIEQEDTLSGLCDEALRLVEAHVECLSKGEIEKAGGLVKEYETILDNMAVMREAIAKTKDEYMECPMESHSQMDITEDYLEDGNRSQPE